MLQHLSNEEDQVKKLLLVFLIGIADPLAAAVGPRVEFVSVTGGQSVVTVVIKGTTFDQVRICPNPGVEVDCKEVRGTVTGGNTKFSVPKDPNLVNFNFHKGDLWALICPKKSPKEVDGRFGDLLGLCAETRGGAKACSYYLRQGSDPLVKEVVVAE